ncbi:D-amino-acid dehydrogenase [Rubrimonas cliftonensis]|uniref:D-amino-acid dehydrogenase n=2 Tax=Rubrimonas cliftonensis TaxID=89524 RepID=A0A1H3VXR1_9RHOB|nr:D-amino-acid dehydrogenase [Rubrimonas cliftonensis]
MAGCGGGRGGEGGTVAVIGAGVVGVATALHLLRAGRAVTLIDRAEPGAATAASYGNAGVLAASAVVPVTVPGILAKAPRMLLDRDQPLFLRWAYLPKLAPWLARYLSHASEAETRRIAAALTPIIGDSLADHQALSAGTPAARFVVPARYLYAYRDRAAFDGDAFGWSVRAANGFAWETLEGEALRAAEPALGPAMGFGVRLDGHGRISDPGAYVAALAREAVRLGARVLRGAVEDVALQGGRVVGVRVDGETIPCEAAALTAGAWSGPLARRLGVAAPLESERGYHLELWGPSAMPRGPIMVSAGKFVATPMEGRLRLAGVVEFGGLRAGPSRAPLEMLRRHVRRAFPALRWEREEEWMGHRPAPADSIPLIGPAPAVRGAWLGFGHHHVGLTGGPRTGRLLAQMIAGERSNIDLSPYAPARFAAARGA